MPIYSQLHRLLRLRARIFPEFAGVDDFQGVLVHPQFWPEQLDYKDKHVVIIGSGATAVTLVPNMADDTASLVMLQRSPTYIANVPAEDPCSSPCLNAYQTAGYSAQFAGRKSCCSSTSTAYPERKPRRLTPYLLNQVHKELGPDYDVDTHFTPNYNPWDQRLCAVPDGDMFTAIREGKADVVTDYIDHFNSSGSHLSW